MSFTFDGLEVACVNLHLQVAPPDLPVRRQRYWGLLGETEIRSLPAGRPIVLDCILRDNFATYAELAALLDRLDLLVGRHGNLSVLDPVNGLNRYFGRATFHGFHPGEDAFAGPKLDEAGTLGGGWWVRGVCLWYDLASIGNTA